jgi:hypothetical protein
LRSRSDHLAIKEDGRFAHFFLARPLEGAEAEVKAEAVKADARRRVMQGVSSVEQAMCKSARSPGARPAKPE